MKIKKHLRASNDNKEGKKINIMEGMMETKKYYVIDEVGLATMQLVSQHLNSQIMYNSQRDLDTAVAFRILVENVESKEIEVPVA